MATLMFFDNDHTYQIDGETLPSVSEIIRFISREIYGNVNQWALDNACDRGTKVHRACELLDKFGEVEDSYDIGGYIEAYISFVRDKNPQWTMIERQMYHREKMYAGTIDRIGVIDGKLTIVDIKTSNTLHKALVSAQLNAYADMYKSHENANIESIAALHLHPDGKYKFHSMEISPEVFTACLTLHEALKKKEKRKDRNE